MKDKYNHIFIFEFDIQKYPPIISLIFFLLKKGESIIVFSQCSDEKFLKFLEQKGVIFYNSINNNVSSNVLIKFFKLIKFRRFVNLEIKKYSNKRVWLFGQTATWLFSKYSFLYETIVYLFEIPKFRIPFRYRLLSPNIDYNKFLNNATRVICCEYNRAHITKAYFNLEVLPMIIPNKPYLDSSLSLVKNDYFEDLFERELVNKKIILYQGIFNYPERKMDSLCDSLEYLPNDFVICLMGEDNDYKLKLKEKYKNDKRIFFLPYIKAPNHLLITKRAYIGYLSYNSEANNISNSLNTLFCAPNKIFEYSKYSIPMLSNDIPALKFLFDSFHSGLVSNNDSFSIAQAILDIDENYSDYSRGSDELFNSVDIESLFLNI